MAIKAVYFDLGGVMVRTEDKAPRTELGLQFGKSYREMDVVVFENGSSLAASLGKITEDQHWQNVIRSLNLPEAEIPRVRAAFFAGDRIDWNIVNFLRGLRGSIKTGLISNAWSGLRAWMVREQFDDAFDYLTISAEVGIMKPEAGIYRYALDQFGVHAEEAVFVDDVEKNIAACEALGMKGVVFRSADQALADVRKMLNS